MSIFGDSERGCNKNDLYEILETYFERNGV